MDTGVHKVKYGSYGFCFIDEILEPAAQIETIGLEKRMSSDYCVDAMKRIDKGRYIFQYTISGYGMFNHNGVTYKIGEGEALLMEIPSNSSYHFSETSDHWEFIYVKLFGSEVQKYWKQVTNNIGVNVKLPLDSDIIRILFKIYRESADNKILDGFKLSALAYQFLMELCRVSKNKATEQYPILIHKTIEVMNENYNKFEGIEEIALKLGISKFHLTRQFTKIIGIPPGKYLAKLRIKKALELLNETNKTVEEISKSVGYSNASYFIKVFQHYVGISPGGFRCDKDIML